MSYQTYITEALVCGSWDSNTADKNFLLFAREAGMVHVHAKSVREERSKQRFALQDASYVRATLIRGKTGWKIASAEPIVNFYTTCEDRASRALVRNVILLLRRVMHGEVQHHALFDDVVEVLRHPAITAHPAVQAILSLRILYALGYVRHEPSYAPYLDEAFPFALAETVSPEFLTQCAITIDHALMQSQL